MRLYYKCAVIICVAVLGFTGCSGTDFGESDMQGNATIKLNEIYCGKEVDICDEKVVRTYLSSDDLSETTGLLLSYSGINKDFQSFKISWSDINQSDEYKFVISENSDLSSAVMQKVKVTEWQASWLIPGKTYYYKVVSDNGESIEDSFVTADKPVRYITASGAFNMRDIGGWKTDDSNKIAYGKLYRGGKLEKNEFIFGGGKKIFHDVLGIKTELDLRTSGYDDGGQNESFIGPDCNYYKIALPAYSHILPQFKWANGSQRYNPATIEAVRAVFACLSDENNYPIYFHCNAGADRTGTLAFLIGGLCGISFADLTRDFELTSFSSSGRRWRSDIKNGSFTDDGVMEDDPTTNYVGWNKMYDQMMKYYSDGGTLSDAIKKYLVEFCGVPEEQIESIIKVMTE